jgi:calpain-7
MLLVQLTHMQSPYSNARHVLYRHTVRSTNVTHLLITPSRDRGLSRSDFTLHALGADGSSLSLDRMSNTLPFSQTVSGSLGARSAGGHAGCASYGSNPQYRITVVDAPSSGQVGTVEKREKGQVRMQVGGQGEGPWNVKMLWSEGGLVHE